MCNYADGRWCLSMLKDFSTATLISKGYFAYTDGPAIVGGALRGTSLKAE
jgi:hypothetical protein